MVKNGVPESPEKSWNCDKYYKVARTGKIETKYIKYNRKYRVKRYPNWSREQRPKQDI